MPNAYIKAVIACDGEGHGAILHFVGEALEHEIDAVGGVLADLGLDDAPKGIFVWEGVYVWSPGGFECPAEGESQPSGSFRPLTDSEWHSLKQGRCPWLDPANWPWGSPEKHQTCCGLHTGATECDCLASDLTDTEWGEQS